MRPDRIRQCKYCEGHETEVGRLSRRHVCESCRNRRMTDCVKDIAGRHGFAHKAWLAGMGRYVDRMQSMYYPGVDAATWTEALRDKETDD